jgi:hypothetical protein
VSDVPLEAPPDAPPPSPGPERDPFWGYSDLLMFLGVSIPCMLLGFGLVKALMTILNLHMLRAVDLLTAQFAGYALLFLALRILLRVQYDRPFWFSLGWRPTRLSAATLILLGTAASIGVIFLGALLRTPNTENPFTELLKDRISIMVVMFFGITLGPLSEELIFRGFLQPLLVRSLGVPLGIFGAALPFGILHFWEYGKSWRHVLLISFAGAAFGVVRQITGSTKASTIMHAAYNTLFFAAFLAQRPPGV